MSICPSCNEERLPGAQFCGSCGSRLIAEPAGEPALDPLLGQTLNEKYVLQQRIGSGGMGDVYRAIHKQLDVPVAVKLVKRALLEDPSVIHRFKREARAASRLRHPNVVGVTDFGQTADGTMFMVMEFVTGRSLARVIKDEGPLPEGRVIHIGAQLLSALAEAHANHLLHRDLKPENVMLEARRGAPDFVKVLDFGIAKVLATSPVASTLTRAGLVCGTPGYMSPEQLRGDVDLDPRSDLFAVGVVLYEMLTLELPFDVQTPMEMLHKHLSERIPPPSARGDRPVGAALEELVMRSMSLLREDRPASAEAMRDELIAAGASSQPEREPPETEQRPATEVLPRPDARPQPSPSGAGRKGARPVLATARTRRTRAVAERPVTPPSGDRLPSEPGGAPQAKVPSSISTVATRQAARFDPEVLKQLEQRLTGVLGPVGPHLTRKASRQASTLPELCQVLSRFLPSRDEQQAFLAWASSQLRAWPRLAPSTPRPAPTTPAVAWDPAVLQRAAQELAVHLGPLARILVRRASARAHDLRELYQILADSLPTESAREAFWRAAPHDGHHG